MTTTIKNLDAALIVDFASKLRGKVIFPADPEYDESRKIWNAMIDRKPALIVKCMGTADVANCVKFARENNFLVSVRGAGHNIAGMSLADDALLIDLSPMKGVWVNPQTRTVLVSPGATLGDIDCETQAYGLATPLGIASTTGISGLTLGGGFGWLSRSYGLTVDNLLSAEVVTAEGNVLQASEHENVNLFWALRGGSGNFGIITSFKFKLHPVGPQLLAGLIVHPFEDAENVLRHYRNFTSSAPDEATCWAILRKAPPLPFLPTEVHGKEVVIIAAVYAGDIKEGEKVFESLRRFGNPIKDVIAPTLFASWQKAFDPLLTSGARNYWKSNNHTELADDLLDILIEYTRHLPSSATEIFIGQFGGAINRVAPDATAYPHRNANYVFTVHTRWENSVDDIKCIEWSKQLFDKTVLYSTGGVYVNFISEGENRISAAYGSNYERLAKIKSKYDPENFFHVNQNIVPT
jgi:FAD/FMN-containing dehydrogenase